MNTEVISILKREASLSDEQIRHMFSNLPFLLEFHTNLLSMIESLVRSWGVGTGSDGVSDLFLKQSEFFGHYQEYLSNYHAASVYVRYYKFESAKVKEVLDGFNNKRSKTTGLTFDDFIVLPVQVCG